MAGEYRFSFGPWNIHEGADPFGPAVREPFSFKEKLDFAVKAGFSGIQFHDDDAVDVSLPVAEQDKRLAELKKMLDDMGLEAEFIAPRLWEHPMTIDGGWTSNSAEARKYAFERSKRAVDIAGALGTRNIVLWPAREGTYIREAKDPKVAADRFVEYIDTLLARDKNIRILGEMKPNEPMDSAFCPTTGHFLAIASRTIDPSRVGILIESAHAILANLEPSEEMGFALSFGKLWGVHLNDQNSLKFDEDKTFGSANLGRAFSQVYILDKYGYGKNGEYVGLDIKVLRTQPREVSMKHLVNSKRMFEMLVEKVRACNENYIEELRQKRDYEELSFYISKVLMGGE
ncbi:MAG: sugar phosphate isomerase/epimerase family protein [Armatimonadota bacterium]|nr:TIM barrel protein [bacterium]